MASVLSYSVGSNCMKTSASTCNDDGLSCTRTPVLIRRWMPVDCSLVVMVRIPTGPTVLPVGTACTRSSTLPLLAITTGRPCGSRPSAKSIWPAPSIVQKLDVSFWASK